MSEQLIHRAQRATPPTLVLVALSSSQRHKQLDIRLRAFTNYPSRRPRTHHAWRLDALRAIVEEVARVLLASFGGEGFVVQTRQYNHADSGLATGTARRKSALTPKAKVQR
jgi:hypothetical protein